MKAHHALGVASFGYGFLALAHTAALFSESRGPDEDRVTAAMQSWTFDAMGVPRTVFDFYMGANVYITAFAALVAVAAWQLGALVRADAAAARPLLWTLLLASAASTGICAVWFFPAPLGCSILGTVGIGAALVLGRRG